MKDLKNIISLKALCNNFRADIVDGPFGSNMKRSDYLTEGIPVLKIQNVKPFKIEMKKMDFVTKSKYDELKRHSYKKGDIIMTKLGDPLGASAIVQDIDDGLIVADLVRIRAQKIDTNYLCYHLNSPKTIDFINSQQKGATRPRIQISVVRELPIYAPPLHVQQRIVAILDEAFDAIDQAKANTEKNLQNAKELFQSELNSIFTNKGEGWMERSILNVCKEIFAGGDAPKENFSAVKTETYHVPIYANAVKDRGLYGFTNEARVLEPSITISARGSGTGHTELRYDSFLPIVRLIVLIPDLSLISLEFLKYSVDNLDILRSGSAIPQLTVPMIKEYKMPLPPLPVQQNIVYQLNTLSLETKQLEENYRMKLESLEELKKSILQKAFSGELTSKKYRIVEHEQLDLVAEREFRNYNNPD